MRTAYIDCIFGVSGDMILGALVACGVPLKELVKELKKLDIKGFDLREKKVPRSGISATYIDVITEEQNDNRHLSHIKDIIESSGLSARVKEQAIRIFTRLAEAESKVHGTTPDKIHFHEVGALDAIVDVVGACIGFEYLGIDTIVSTPLHFGTGTVKCAHGLMPVPVPAVVELSGNVPVVRTTFEGEMTTPTGAAIICTLASSFGYLDNFTVDTTGYGAGSKERDDIPNVLRIAVGEASRKFDEDRCVLIETNIDDMNPEIFGYLSDRLFDEGVKDVSMTPIIMKKGRPGTMLSVLADEVDMNRIIEVLFTETTTIGIRFSRVSRKKLQREERTVKTEYGEVKVKIAYINGNRRITPEFDDCTRIAREKGIPLQKVYDVVRKGNLE